MQSQGQTNTGSTSITPPPKQTLLSSFAAAKAAGTPFPPLLATSGRLFQHQQPQQLPPRTVATTVPWQASAGARPSGIPVGIPAANTGALLQDSQRPRPVGLIRPPAGAPAIIDAPTASTPAGFGRTPAGVGFQGWPPPANTTQYVTVTPQNPPSTSATTPGPPSRRPSLSSHLPSSFLNSSSSSSPSVSQQRADPFLVSSFVHTQAPPSRPSSDASSGLPQVPASFQYQAYQSTPQPPQQQQQEESLLLMTGLPNQVVHRSHQSSGAVPILSQATVPSMMSSTRQSAASPRQYSTHPTQYAPSVHYASQSTLLPQQSQLSPMNTLQALHHGFTPAGSQQRQQFHGIPPDHFLHRVDHSQSSVGSSNASSLNHPHPHHHQHHPGIVCATNAASVGPFLSHFDNGSSFIPGLFSHPTPASYPLSFPKYIRGVYPTMLPPPMPVPQSIVSAIPISPEDPLRAPAGCCEVCWDPPSPIPVSPDHDQFMYRCSGCSITVHKACYGVQLVDPSTLSTWLCSVCEYWQLRGYSVNASSASTTGGSGTGSIPILSLLADDPVAVSPTASPPSLRCVMCCRVGGAMKVGPEGLFVHVNCVLYTGEGPCFRLPSLLQSPIYIRRFLQLHAKKNFLCSICGSPNGYTHACGYYGCQQRMHIPCAFQRDLKPRVQTIRLESSLEEKVVKIVACQFHNSLEARQQILENQVHLMSQAESMGWDLVSGKRIHHHRHRKEHRTGTSFMGGVRPVPSSTYGRPTGGFTAGFGIPQQRRRAERRDGMQPLQQPGFYDMEQQEAPVKRRWGTPTPRPPFMDWREEEKQRQQQQMMGQDGTHPSLMMGSTQPRRVTPGVTEKMKHRAIDKAALRAQAKEQKKLLKAKAASLLEGGFPKSKMKIERGAFGRLKPLGRRVQPSLYSDATGKLVPTSSTSPDVKTESAVQSNRRVQSREEEEGEEEVEVFLSHTDEDGGDSVTYGSSKPSYLKGEVRDKMTKPKYKLGTTTTGGQFGEKGASVHQRLPTTASGRYGLSGRHDRRGRGVRRRISTGRSPSIGSRQDNRMDGSGSHPARAHPSVHTIQKGVRLKWLRYESLFKRHRFNIKDALREASDLGAWLSMDEVISRYHSSANPDQPDVSQVLLFLLSAGSPPLDASFMNATPDRLKMLDAMLLEPYFLQQSRSSSPSSRAMTTPESATTASYLLPLTALLLLSVQHPDVTTSSAYPPGGLSDGKAKYGAAIWSVWSKHQSHRRDGAKASLTPQRLLETLEPLESYVRSNCAETTRLQEDPQFMALWSAATSKRPELTTLIALARLLLQQVDFRDSIALWLKTNSSLPKSAVLSSPLMGSQFLTVVLTVRQLFKLDQAEYVPLTPYQAYLMARHSFSLQPDVSRQKGGIGESVDAGSTMDGGCEGVATNKSCKADSSQLDVAGIPRIGIELIDNEDPNEHRVDPPSTTPAVEPTDQQILNLESSGLEECSSIDSTSPLSAAWTRLLEVQHQLYPTLQTPLLSTDSSTVMSQLPVVPTALPLPARSQLIQPECTATTIGEQLEAILSQSESLAGQQSTVMDIGPFMHLECWRSKSTMTESQSKGSEMRLPAGCDVPVSPLDVSMKVPQIVLPSHRTRHGVDRGSKPTSVQSSVCSTAVTPISPPNSSLVNTTTGRTSRRYIYLGPGLWDVDVPLQDCDPALVEALSASSTRSPQRLSSSPSTRSTRAATSAIEREKPSMHPDDFVGRESAFYVSLYNSVTSELSRAKQMYIDRLLMDEELPTPILSLTPSVMPDLNALFLCTTRWGRIASHLAWGLSDQPDHDFVKAEAIQHASYNPITHQLQLPHSETLTQASAGSSHRGGEFSVPCGSFGRTVVALPEVLRQMNPSDPSRSLIRPFETLSESLVAPCPPYSVCTGRVKTCCICFGAEWDSVNSIITCMQCCCSVHKGCYSITEIALDSDTDNWLCKRCEHEKRRSVGAFTVEAFVAGSIRCALCNTLGGALKRTVEEDGRWVHLTCAFLLLPEVVPTDFQLFDSWDLRGLQEWRTSVDCSVCLVQRFGGHLDGSGEDSEGGRQRKRAKRSIYHLDCYPLRLSQESPHQPLCRYEASRRGACLACSYPGCAKRFHPMCAWLSGMYMQVSRVNNQFYYWKPTKEYSECMYFPAIQVTVFCFDHTPDQPVEGTLPECLDPSYRSSGYQRCLRHRRYLNRDLYPHLCSPYSKRSLNRQDPPPLTSIAGGLGGTLHSSGYGVDSSSYQMVGQSVSKEENDAPGKVKLQLPPSHTETKASKEATDIIESVPPPGVNNIITTMRPDSTPGIKTEGDPSRLWMGSDAMEDVTPTEHTASHRHFSSSSSSSFSSATGDQTVYMSPRQYYGVDPINPEDPNSVYLLGKSAINDRGRLRQSAVTKLNLTFPRPNDLTPFPDKYCDRFCAVCFSHSEPPEPIDLDLPVGSLIDTVDPCLKKVYDNIHRYAHRLVRCRRCGLTVHPTCYGTARYPVHSQLRPLLELPEREESWMGGRTLKASDAGPVESSQWSDQCSDRADLTCRVVRSSFIETLRHDMAPSLPLIEDPMICASVSLDAGASLALSTSPLLLSSHQKPNKRIRADRLLESSSEYILNIPHVTEAGIEEGGTHFLLPPIDSETTSTVAKSPSGIDRPSSDSNSQVMTDVVSIRLDSPDELEIPDASIGQQVLTPDPFTCEVCSGSHLIDDITCLLCSRRAGALKSIRINLDWNPLFEDEDLNACNKFSNGQIDKDPAFLKDSPHTEILHAHVTCLLYAPGVTMSSSETFHPIRGLSRLIRSSLYGAYQCELCFSSRGVCLPCSQTDCPQYFHPLCAQLEGLILEQRVEEHHYSQRSAITVVAYCKKHSKELAPESIPLSLLDQLRAQLEKLRCCRSEIGSRLKAKGGEISRYIDCMPALITSSDARYGYILPGVSVDGPMPSRPFVPITKDGTVAEASIIPELIQISCPSPMPSEADGEGGAIREDGERELMMAADRWNDGAMPIEQRDRTQRAATELFKYHKPRLRRDSSTAAPPLGMLGPSDIFSSPTPSPELRSRDIVAIPPLDAFEGDRPTTAAASKLSTTLLDTVHRSGRHLGSSSSPKRKFPVSGLVGPQARRGSYVEDMAVLPQLTPLTVDELLAAGHGRELTVPELIEVSRQLLPEFAKRKRGRPSAKEKVVRAICFGAYNYYKSSILTKQPQAIGNRDSYPMTPPVVLNREQLAAQFTKELPFWEEAIRIAEAYGRSIQAAVILPVGNINQNAYAHVSSLFCPSSRTTRFVSPVTSMEDGSETRPSKRVKRQLRVMESTGASETLRQTDRRLSTSSASSTESNPALPMKWKSLSAIGSHSTKNRDVEMEPVSVESHYDLRPSLLFPHTEGRDIPLLMGMATTIGETGSQRQQLGPSHSSLLSLAPSGCVEDQEAISSSSSWTGLPAVEDIPSATAVTMMIPHPTRVALRSRGSLNGRGRGVAIYPEYYETEELFTTETKGESDDAMAMMVEEQRLSGVEHAASSLERDGHEAASMGHSETMVRRSQRAPTKKRKLAGSDTEAEESHSMMEREEERLEGEKPRKRQTTMGISRTTSSSDALHDDMDLAPMGTNDQARDALLSETLPPLQPVIGGGTLGSNPLPPDETQLGQSSAVNPHQPMFSPLPSPTCPPRLVPSSPSHAPHPPNAFLLQSMDSFSSSSSASGLFALTPIPPSSPPLRSVPGIAIGTPAVLNAEEVGRYVSSSAAGMREPLEGCDQITSQIASDIKPVQEETTVPSKRRGEKERTADPSVEKGNFIAVSVDTEAEATVSTQCVHTEQQRTLSEGETATVAANGERTEHRVASPPPPKLSPRSERRLVRQRSASSVEDAMDVTRTGTGAKRGRPDRHITGAGEDATGLSPREGQLLKKPTRTGKIDARINEGTVDEEAREEQLDRRAEEKRLSVRRDDDAAPHPAADDTVRDQGPMVDQGPLINKDGVRSVNDRHEQHADRAIIYKRRRTQCSSDDTEIVNGALREPQERRAPSPTLLYLSLYDFLGALTQPTYPTYGDSSTWKHCFPDCAFEFSSRHRATFGSPSSPSVSNQPTRRLAYGRAVVSRQQQHSSTSHANSVSSSPAAGPLRTTTSGNSAAPVERFQRIRLLPNFSAADTNNATEEANNFIHCVSLFSHVPLQQHPYTAAPDAASIGSRQREIAARILRVMNHLRSATNQYGMPLLASLWVNPDNRRLYSRIYAKAIDYQFNAVDYLYAEFVNRIHKVVPSALLHQTPILLGGDSSKSSSPITTALWAHYSGLPSKRGASKGVPVPPKAKARGKQKQFSSPPYPRSVGDKETRNPVESLDSIGKRTKKLITSSAVTEEDASSLYQSVRTIITRLLKQTLATVREVEPLEPVPSWMWSDPQWRGEWKMEAFAVGQKIRLFSMTELRWREGLVVFYDASRPSAMSHEQTGHILSLVEEDGISLLAKYPSLEVLVQGEEKVQLVFVDGKEHPIRGSEMTGTVWIRTDIPAASTRQNYLVCFKSEIDSGTRCSSPSPTFEWADIRTNEIVRFETGNKYYLSELLGLDAKYHLRTHLFLVPALQSTNHIPSTPRLTFPLRCFQCSRRLKTESDADADSSCSEYLMCRNVTRSLTLVPFKDPITSTTENIQGVPATSASASKQNDTIDGSLNDATATSFSHLELTACAGCFCRPCVELDNQARSWDSIVTDATWKCPDCQQLAISPVAIESLSESAVSPEHIREESETEALTIESSVSQSRELAKRKRKGDPAGRSQKRRKKS